MDATLLELIESMEIKVNIMEEAQRVKAFHDLGIQKMNEVRNIEMA